MSERTVLLTGAAGQLGSALRVALGTAARVDARTRAELDVRDAEAVRRAVREARPDVIVNAAAFTAVDDAETRHEEAWAVNAAAPGVLAGEAARLGAVLVHYSTDYVFDGLARRPYVEDAPVRPLGAYGASKLAGEQEVLASGARALVLRTGWLYSARGRSFFGTMVRLATEAAAEPVRVVNDRRGTPTSCAFVAEATATILASPRLAGATPDDEVWGTYHLAGAGETTWHGFAEAIFAGLARRGVAVRPLVAIPSSAYPTPAVRPEYSVLDTTRVRQTFGVSPTPWEAQLERVLDERLADAPSAPGAPAHPQQR